MRDEITNFVLNIIHTLSNNKHKSGWEGRTIRYSRSRKFRKRYVFFKRSIQVLIVWYLLIFSVIQLNSFTNAAFNDVEEVQATLHVKWPVDEWDKSSLDFDKGKLARGGTCLPPMVYAEVYNDGEDMTFSTWKWELFKVNKGQRVPISDVLESGEVPMIKAGEKGIIKTTQLQALPGEGQYRFKVIKPDRPGQEAIWSEPIEIEGCTTQKMEKEHPVTEEETSDQNTESIEKIDTNTNQNSETTSESTEAVKGNLDSEPEKETTEVEKVESKSINEEDVSSEETIKENQSGEGTPTESVTNTDENSGS